MFGPMGGGKNDMKGPTQEQDEEDEEWARSIKIQEEMIKKTMRKEGKEDEWIDWDEKIKEHRERIGEEGERSRKG